MASKPSSKVDGAQRGRRIGAAPRYLYRILWASALFWPTVTTAQIGGDPIWVAFQRSNDQGLDHAILTAFSEPPFRTAEKPTVDALVVSISEKPKKRKDKSGAIHWEFMVKFTRNSDSLGESYEACPATKLTECTNQLRIDAATAMGRDLTVLPSRP